MARGTGFFAFLMGALIFGCATVSSVQPVGERPKEISPSEWDGTWISKSHSITIKVLDEQKGLLQVAWVEEKEGGLKIGSYQVAVRESGEWLFGNVKETQDSASYYWALVKKDAGQIIVWTRRTPSRRIRLSEDGLENGVSHQKVPKMRDWGILVIAVIRC